MENPTQEGASIHERLTSYIDGDTSDATQVPTQQEEETEEVTEEPASEEITGEVAEEAESEETEAEEVETETDDTTEALDLSDVAHALGINDDDLDVSDDGDVLVKVKVDGEESQVKLSDLRASYQKNGHLDNKTREAVQLQEQLQQKIQEADTQTQARIQQLDDLVQLSYQDLMAEKESIDWEELRVTQPDEWSAKKVEFQDRERALAERYQIIQQEREQQQQHQTEQYQHHLQQEQQKLLLALPEWSNPDVAQKENQEITKYAVSQGYPAEQIAHISNHLDVVMLRKAMMFDKLQQSKPAIAKKVKKAPKIAKPGQPPSKSDLAAQKAKSLKDNIKTGRKGSVAEYLLGTGKV